MAERVCGDCFRPIIGGTVLSAFGADYHAACFRCFLCRTPLGRSFMAPPDGTKRPYCAGCHAQYFATRCYSCGGPMRAGESYKTAMGHAYHDRCFRCAACAAPLAGGKFVRAHGLPHCRACASAAGDTPGGGGAYDGAYDGASVGWLVGAKLGAKLGCDETHLPVALFTINPSSALVAHIEQSHAQPITAHLFPTHVYPHFS